MSEKSSKSDIVKKRVRWDVEEILSQRSIKRTKTGVLGFCDSCERLTTVQSNRRECLEMYCADCEVAEISLSTEFMSLKPDMSEVDKNSPISEKPAIIECSGCRDDQANQLAHMNIGGCLYSEDVVDS